jgi:Uma2 family endonuclease
MYALDLRDDEDHHRDQHVVLRGTWRDFERLLAIRGDEAGPRMYFLDGVIELMSPGSLHEYRKKLLSRLLEIWAIERGVTLEGYGSWTLKRGHKKAGAEPDECYIVGAEKKKVPDLAIEVEISHGVLEKHEIYRRIGVRELWTVRRDGDLLVRVLVDGRYVERSKSALLPRLDLQWLWKFVAYDLQTKAVRAMLREMRTRKRA